MVAPTLHKILIGARESDAGLQGAQRLANVPSVTRANFARDPVAEPKDAFGSGGSLENLPFVK